MKTLRPSLTVPEPSVDQVLWRSGCPAGKAGTILRKRASVAVSHLMSSLSLSWCGAVFFHPSEVPEPFCGIWPGLPVTLMAATLGKGVDDIVSRSSELDGFMVDSAASIAVESYMKRLQRTLADHLGMEPTKRVAPGYGDMPLSLQKEIIAMFPDSGISCGESYMLSPVKSMTGVTGWVMPKS